MYFNLKWGYTIFTLDYTPEYNLAYLILYRDINWAGGMILSGTPVPNKTYPQSPNFLIKVPSMNIFN